MSTPTTDRSHPTIWILVASMATAGLTLHVFSLTDLGAFDTPVTTPWVMLAAGFATAEVLVIQIRGRKDSHAISLTEVPLLIGRVLASPLALITGRLAGSAAVCGLHRRQRSFKLAFNVALAYLETVAAIIVYHIALGTQSPHSARGYAAAIAAGTVAHIVGAALVSLAISLHEPGRSRAAITRTLAISTLISGSAALLGIVGLLAVWHDSRLSPAVVIGGLLLHGVTTTRFGRIVSLPNSRAPAGVAT
ncbi:MAG: hypothetical protein ACE5E8_08285 [Acidimicrobiia bacterium]